MTAGEMLRQARERAGISLSAMAERTHFSKSHLGNVETGKRAVTAEIVSAYEREVGEEMDRRGVLSGLAATVVAPIATAEPLYKGFSEAAYRRPPLVTG